MKPSIVSQDQKLEFMEKYEAQQRVMHLRSELASIHTNKTIINKEVNLRLAQYKVLEERVKKIQEELQVLQTLL